MRILSHIGHFRVKSFLKKPASISYAFTLVLMPSLLLSNAYFRQRAVASASHDFGVCERNLMSETEYHHVARIPTGMTIIVNSHVKSSLATECLVGNMLSLGLNGTCRVIFVLGGAAEPSERVDHHNFTWIWVTHDAVDLNGLIWAQESFDGRWFVYVHNTTLFGMKVNAILVKLRSSEPRTQKLRRYPSMNMGTYLTTDLRRSPVKERLAYIKHTYDQLNITERKLQAVLDEDIVFKLLSAPTMGGWRFTITNWLFRLHRRLEGQREFDRRLFDTYGSGTLRDSRYHPNLDLFKFTANYDYHRSGKVVVRNFS